MFHMVRTINSDCFPKQHYPVGLCSGDVMFPVRYELDFYIGFRKFLSSAQPGIKIAALAKQGSPHHLKLHRSAI
jgi:hypothetical protein